MIRISKTKLRQEVTTWQTELEYKPNWSAHEAVGRLLYWLGDPAASAHFQQAARIYLQYNTNASAFLKAGNWVRLAGNLPQACALLEQSYALFAPKLVQPNDQDLQMIIECCFLLERYAEIPAFAQQLATRRIHFKLRAFPIARLAQAVQDQDQSEALAIAEHFSRSIRSGRSRIASTGLMSLWDWYEIALRLAQDLGADIPEGTLP
ncbi:MAG: hypothetical protein AAGF95_05120 [Chloroflexota bacterium]